MFNTATKSALLSSIKAVWLTLTLGLIATVANANEPQTPDLEVTTEQSQPTDPYEGITITVNINQAGVDELATLLVGIGHEKAKRIVEYRESYGLFTSVEDLTKVKGIGAATVEKNRQRILL